MSTVICQRNFCIFNGSGFCRKESIVLTSGGACNEWYDKNNQPYGYPLYQIQEEAMKYDRVKEVSRENKISTESDCGNKGTVEGAGNTECGDDGNN